ncbi:hypothetical protein POM88_053192 [Heracleum sosnowskyi]|uniref:Uncharacterized protein n=1 Tax=Heracleum sosnowskyi TaxID=360622 RepID=A0AAD8LW73_9APIA|nr:hypothetical protein POM88_054432 [Heracleum sosnowskyi]KAK1352761.1 hypothetical protein POM88_053192 [Heracleum sosnowskyi]
MHLVHTSQSIQRAKEAITALPSNADSVEFDDEDSQDTENVGVSETTPSQVGLPDWLFTTNAPFGDFNVEVMRQYQSAMAEHQNADPQRKAVLQQVVASLKLEKMQMLLHRTSIEEVNTQVRDVKDSVNSMLEQLAPTATSRVRQQRITKEDSQV